MDQQLRFVIYNLERRYKTKLQVVLYQPSDIDYSDPKYTAGSRTVNVIGIALPHNTTMLSFEPQQGDFKLFDRMFLIKIKNLEFPLEVRNTYIMHAGKRYDIKKLEELENVYYLAKCKAIGVEPDEQSYQ